MRTWVDASTRRVDPRSHGSALEPGLRAFAIPAELVKGIPEEGDALLARHTGHLVDRHAGVLGRSAQGELEVQISGQGPVHPEPPHPFPEGRPRGLGPGELHVVGEAVELADLVFVDADLQVLHMTL